MLPKIIVNGAQGKMGSLVCAAIEQDDSLILSAKAGSKDNLPQLIRDLGANLVVDFTTAKVVGKNCQTILASGSNALIGTTGMSPSDQAKCAELALTNNLRCLIIPNFSIGANLMIRFASFAASYFDDIEIVECHGPHKLDFPSGTAIATAQQIALNRKKAPIARKEHSVINNTARGSVVDGINIHSMRLAGSVAHQSVVLGNEYESLTIKHDTVNRAAFMPAVVLACKKIYSLPAGLHYGLDKIL